MRDKILTSSITVLQALGLLQKKLSAHDQIVIKNLKKRKDGYQTI